MGVQGVIGECSLASAIGAWTFHSPIESGTNMAAVQQERDDLAQLHKKLEALVESTRDLNTFARDLIRRQSSSTNDKSLAEYLTALWVVELEAVSLPVATLMQASEMVNTVLSGSWPSSQLDKLAAMIFLKEHHSAVVRASRERAAQDKKEDEAKQVPEEKKETLKRRKAWIESYLAKDPELEQLKKGPTGN